MESKQTEITKINEIENNFPINEESTSTELIQKILYLYSSNSKSISEIENNISKSLCSNKYMLFDFLKESDIYKEFYNPNIIKTQYLTNKIQKINKSARSTLTNSELKQKIKEYYKLKRIINNFKKDNSNKENNIYEKLYIINHPLISLFNNEINIEEIRSKININFKNQMKNFSTEIISQENNDISSDSENSIINFNERNDEEIEINNNSSSSSSSLFNENDPLLGNNENNYHNNVEMVEINPNEQNYSEQVLQTEHLDIINNEYELHFFPEQHSNVENYQINNINNNINYSTGNINIENT